MLHLLDYQFQLLPDYLLEQEQFSDKVKVKDTSQLISGISNGLQKLLKYFNDTTISTFFSVLIPSNFPVIFVL